VTASYKLTPTRRSAAAAAAAALNTTGRSSPSTTATHRQEAETSKEQTTGKNKDIGSRDGKSMFIRKKLIE